MKRLNKAQILAALDLPYEDVNVPEWGGSVRVKTLTGEERDGFEASMVEARGKSREVNMANIRAKLVVLAAVDDEGKRLFSDNDATVLGCKSGKALDRVFAVAQRLAGLSKEDLDDLGKPLSADQSGASTSASPSPSAKPSDSSSKK